MNNKKELKELPSLPKGEGSFRYVNDGKYIRYEKIIDLKPYAGKKRISVYGKTPQECRAKMKAREQEVRNKAAFEYRHSDSNPEITLYDAIANWNEKAKNNIKATSFDRRERTNNRQIQDSKIGRKPVREITSVDLMEFFYWLQYDATAKSGKGYSDSVIKKVYDILNGFFRDFYANDMDHNPMNAVKRPVKRNSIQAYTEDDLERLGKPIETDLVLSDDEIKLFKDFVYQEPKIGVTGRSVYGLAIYFVMLTFLRSGEARALRWGDIHIDDKKLIVNKSVSRVVNRQDEPSKTQTIITPPKTKNSFREVFLTDDAIAAITKYKSRRPMTQDSDYVFYTDKGKIIGESQLWRTVQGILIGAGLKRDPNKTYKESERIPPERNGFSMHYLRHTGISYYLRHGVPVDVISKLAGHSSIRITENIYYHVIKDQKKEALEQMNNAMKNI